MVTDWDELLKPDSFGASLTADQYADFEAVWNEIFGTRTRAAEVWLDEYLNDTSAMILSFEIKRELALKSLKVLHSEVARLWAYAHLSEKDVLAILSFRPTLARVKAITSNPNFSYTILKVLLQQGGRFMNTLPTLLEGLPIDKVDEEWIRLLNKKVHPLNSYPYIVEAYADFIRRVHGLDENIPDNWVLKLIENDDKDGGN